jgi:hypothetical protein
MKTEISNLVNYTATRIMDSFIQGHTKMELDEHFDAKDIFKDMANNETKKILMQNVIYFNESLNEIIWNRMEYLMVEGFIVSECGTLRMRNEIEIEVFANSKDEE